MPVRFFSETQLISFTLSVRGGKAAIAFYEAAFGAEVLFLIEGESDSVVARLTAYDSQFWIADESPENQNYSPQTLGGSTVRLLLLVDDPDNSFWRALNAGATIISPVTEQHGWRIGRIADPFGHHWEFAAEIPPKDWAH